jgi:Holliday junction resolvasome RuvABC endonuclease subunit
MPPALTQGGVLTLDLGGVVGWAYAPLDAVSPYADTITLPKVGGEGMRYASFENELAALIERLAPSAMVLEAPLRFAAQNNERACRQQYTLRGFAYSEGHRASVPVSEQDVDTIRLEVFGICRFSGRDPKAEVVRMLRARRILVTNHNAADAVAIWLWHKQRMRGISPVAGALWRSALEREALQQ